MKHCLKAIPLIVWLLLLQGSQLLVVGQNCTPAPTPATSFSGALNSATADITTCVTSNTSIIETLSNSTTAHWYKFDLPANERNLQIDLTINTGDDLDLLFYTSAQVRAASTQIGIGGTEQIIINDLEEATYYVKIVAKSSSTSTIYNLHIHTSSTPYANPTEQLVYMPKMYQTFSEQKLTYTGDPVPNKTGLINESATWVRDMNGDILYHSMVNAQGELTKNHVNNSSACVQGDCLQLNAQNFNKNTIDYAETYMTHDPSQFGQSYVSSKRSTIELVFNVDNVNESGTLFSIGEAIKCNLQVFNKWYGGVTHAHTNSYAIEVYLKYYDNDGALKTSTFKVPLTGSNVLSPNYYQKGKKIHLALTVDLYEQEKANVKIYIDGISTEKMQFKLKEGKELYFIASNNTPIYYSEIPGRRTHPGNFRFFVDEFCYYTDAIPAGLVAKHADAIKNNQHYSFLYDAIQDHPVYKHLHGPLNRVEFLPNHFDDTNENSPSFNTQLQEYFPNPRHNSYNTAYLNTIGFANYYGLDATTYEELCENWNYYLPLGQTGNALGATGKWVDQDIIQLAVDNPQYKRSITTFWAARRDFRTHQSIAPYAAFHNLECPNSDDPPVCKIANPATPGGVYEGEAGMMFQGQASNSLATNVTNNKFTNVKDIMDALSTTTQTGTNTLGTNRVDMIVENDETGLSSGFNSDWVDVYDERFRWQKYRNADADIERDITLAAFNADNGFHPTTWTETIPYSTITNPNPSDYNWRPDIDDYYAWYSNRAALSKKYYLDELATLIAQESGQVPSMLLYSTVDGARNIELFENHGFHYYYQLDYKNTRGLNVLRSLAPNQTDIRFSTPSIYVPAADKVAHKYDNVGGGLMDYFLSRSYELHVSAGKDFSAPFINPGATYNVKGLYRFSEIVQPTNYLGSLKVMGNMGALFFNNWTSWKNSSSAGVHYYHDKANIGYKLAMPSYAQATFHRQQDLFMNSDLLTGNRSFEGLLTNPTTNQTIDANFFFDTGHPMDFVTVRKLRDPSKSVYLINGTTLSNSNIAGAAPLQKSVTIDLEGSPLTFDIKKGGATYYYDNTDVNNPIFYPLDYWHEIGNPYYWDKSIWIEAEDFDKASGASITTEGSQSGQLGGRDFSTAYDTYASGNELEYTFQPKHASQGNMDLWIKLKGNQFSSIDLEIDGPNNVNFPVIFNISPTNGVNTWYNITSNLNFQVGVREKYTIKINAFGADIDKLLLVPNSQTFNPTTPFNANFNVSSSSACQGQTVSFTNNSTEAPYNVYEWDFGDSGASYEKDPSHTYREAGTYTVTLTVRNTLLQTSSTTSKTVQITDNSLSLTSSDIQFNITSPYTNVVDIYAQLPIPLTNGWVVNWYDYNPDTESIISTIKTQTVTNTSNIFDLLNQDVVKGKGFRIELIDPSTCQRIYKDITINKGGTSYSSDAAGLTIIESTGGGYTDEYTGLTTIADEEPLLTVQLYPNPIAVGQAITLDFSTITDAHVSIYNLNGALLHTQEMMNAQRLEIVTNQLIAGTYIVQITTPEGVTNKKMVVF